MIKHPSSSVSSPSALQNIAETERQVEEMPRACLGARLIPLFSHTRQPLTRILHPYTPDLRNYVGLIHSLITPSDLGAIRATRCSSTMKKHSTLSTGPCHQTPAKTILTTSGLTKSKCKYAIDQAVCCRESTPMSWSGGRHTLVHHVSFFLFEGPLPFFSPRLSDGRMDVSKLRTPRLDGLFSQFSPSLCEASGFYFSVLSILIHE